MDRKFAVGLTRLAGSLALAAVALAACALPAERNGIALGELDSRLQAETAQRALETMKVGEASNWTNPESKTLGTITPVRTYETQSGRNCREYQQTITRGEVTEIHYDVACRDPDGLWQNVGPGDEGWPARYGRRYAYTPYAYPPLGAYRRSFGYAYSPRFPYRHGYPYYSYPYFDYGARHRLRYRSGFGVHLRYGN